MAMRCPRCRAIAKTRTSVEPSLLGNGAAITSVKICCAGTVSPATEIDGSLNQTQPAPGAMVPQEAFPRSHHGEDQLSLAL